MPLDPSSISDSDSSGDEVDFGGELPTVIQPATQAVPPAVLQAVPHVRVPPIKTGYCIKQGARVGFHGNTLKCNKMHGKPMSVGRE